MPQPRKRFGQHFLQDQAVIERIVGALSPNVGEHLIEIGPGQGALTLPIIQRGQTLTVIELDRDLLQPLTQRIGQQGLLQVYQADALTFDFADLKRDERPLRVFGNLPYNISTPLIFHLLEFVPIIHDMLFMLQKEVAERLAAPPSSAHYGRLSVMVQYYCQVELLFHVSAAAFYPPPQVQSSIVKLLPYAVLPYVAKDTKVFAEVVKQAFGQRRKTLRNSLHGLVSDAIWQQVGIDSGLRAEALSVREFVEISNALRRTL
ncbi:MAG TPA: 16S rRNA (adenine(1518)-N(6)/adenine(1519)-N(6))-dimethyltransferase RsmA [Gammaproteobacteria bacterium]|jgi:16S rRNA (adenine1518-N6/adenine1519-N6)-dimethyltransferase|nr:16S rRNA (adenine(1518)-N(6)/adenine(1519)-N(6))-dimethyltransferase RsmA [Gammaproteobacteria bacterium]